MATHPEPLEPSEPGHDLPFPEPEDEDQAPAAGPGRGSRVAFGARATSPLVGLPVIVSKRFADGQRNVYRWIGQFDHEIPDKGAVLEAFGGGKFKLECPEGGRQYWEIAERHRAIHGRTPAAPVGPAFPPRRDPPAPAAEPAGLSALVAQLYRGQGQIQATIARVEARLINIGHALELVGHRLEAGAAAARQVAPPPPPTAPAPIPAAAPDMLGQLQGLVALKRTMDDLGGLFDSGGAGGSAEPASEWSWLADALKSGVSRAMTQGGAMPPGMAPPNPLAHAAPLAAVPPVAVPGSPAATVTPLPAAAPSPAGGPILPGSTPELEVLFDGLAEDLGYTPEQARYYALSQGWSLPEAVAYGRQMLAEEGDPELGPEGDAPGPAG